MTRARDLSNDEANNGGATPPFVAGKNKVINGDFGVWQRGTSFSTPNATYTADRWFQGADSVPTTWAISQQTFTPGTAPVAGYEGTYFYRSLCTTTGSATIADITHRIEDVRTFAGQTVTLSFWAKADTTRTSLIYLVQVFGTGGSSGVVPSTPSITFTNTWQRFTFTMSVPSIAGKTIGAGSYLGVNIRQALANGSTLDIWGVQLEAGSVATPFQTATGTVAGELAACQRYYWKNIHWGTGTIYGNNMYVSVMNPIQMRTSPSVSKYANGDAMGLATISTITVNDNSQYGFNYNFAYTGSNFLATRCFLYLEASAEL